MTTSIVINVDTLVDNIYAASAMYNMLNSKTVTPPPLHRDHRPVLVKALQGAFVETCAGLIKHVVDMETDETMLRLDIDFPRGFDSAKIRPVRLLIEHSITCRALAAAYLNHDSALSESNRRDASEAECDVLLLINSSPTAPLVPWP